MDLLTQTPIYRPAYVKRKEEAFYTIIFSIHGCDLLAKQMHAVYLQRDILSKGLAVQTRHSLQNHTCLGAAVGWKLHLKFILSVLERLCETGLKLLPQHISRPVEATQNKGNQTHTACNDSL